MASAGIKSSKRLRTPGALGHSRSVPPRQRPPSSEAPLPPRPKTPVPIPRGKSKTPVPFLRKTPSGKWTTSSDLSPHPPVTPVSPGTVPVAATSDTPVERHFFGTSVQHIASKASEEPLVSSSLKDLAFVSLRQQATVGSFYTERTLKMLTRVCEAYSVLEGTINRAVKEEISVMRKYLVEHSPDQMTAYCNSFDMLRSFVYDLSKTANEIEIQVRSQVIAPLQEYHSMAKSTVSATSKLHDAAHQEYNAQVRARETLRYQCQKYVKAEKETFALISSISQGIIPAQIKKKAYGDSKLSGLKSMFKKKSRSLRTAGRMFSGDVDFSSKSADSGSAKRSERISKKLSSLFSVSRSRSDSSSSAVIGKKSSMGHSPAPPIPLDEDEEDDDDVDADECLTVTRTGSGALVLPSSGARAHMRTASSPAAGTRPTDYFYISSESWDPRLYKQLTAQCATESKAPLLYELVSYLDIRDNMNHYDRRYLKQTQLANETLKHFENIRENSLAKLKTLELLRLTATDESFFALGRLVNSDTFLVNERQAFQDFQSTFSFMRADRAFKKFVSDAVIFQRGAYKSPQPLTYEMRYWRTHRHLIADLMNLQQQTYPQLAIPFIVEYLISFIETDPFAIEKDPDLLVDPNLFLMTDEEKEEWKQQLHQLVKGSPVVIRDYLHACGLLKLWLSEMVEPLVPYYLYESCLDYDGSVTLQREADRELQQREADQKRGRRGTLRKFIPRSSEPTMSITSRLSMKQRSFHGSAVTVSEHHSIISPTPSGVTAATGVGYDPDSVSARSPRPMSAAEAKAARRTERITRNVLAKMDPCNVMTLSRIVNFVKQILENGKGLLSNLAFELGPLLLRNPVVRDRDTPLAAGDEVDMYKREITFVSFVLRTRIPMLNDAVVSGAHTLGHLHASSREATERAKAAKAPGH